MRRVLAVLTAMVLVAAAAGCSDGSAGAPGASSAPPSYIQWDPRSWQSPVRIPVPQVNEPEAEQLRQAYLSDLAEGLSAVPKAAPKVVRVVLPEELGTVQAKCLTDAGWPGAVGEPDGGLRMKNPPKSQQKAFDIARYTCAAQYPVDPRVMKLDQPSVEAVQWLYLKEYAIPCVTAHGFESPTPLPTKEAYIAGASFQLYPSKPVQKPDELLRDCPQSVPTVTLLKG